MDHHDNHVEISLISSNPNDNNNNNNLKRKFARGFLRALMRVHNRRPSSDSAAKRQQRVKLAADMAMASAVGSRRVWSRSVLRSIRTQRRRSFLAARSRSTGGAGDDGGSTKTVMIKKLRGLVPGGEDLDICSLLDETFHYVKCLTTQVKVMKSIADVYSSST